MLQLRFVRYLVNEYVIICSVLTRHLSIIRMTNRRRLCYVILPLDCCIMMSINFYIARPKGKGKVFPYSLPSIGPGADPGVLAVSPQVTWSESRHRPGSRLPWLSAIARPTCCFILMYTCGLAVVIKRICYVMLRYVMSERNKIIERSITNIENMREP